jgi:hypothetical protein
LNEAQEKLNISDVMNSITSEDIKLIRLAITRLIGNNLSYVSSESRDKGNDVEINDETDKLWKLLNKFDR